MPLEHFWDFSEYTLIPNDKTLYYPASMNVNVTVNTVDDELCCAVEVLFSVLSYLNWQAASAAIWLNSHSPILVEESWQEDAWELLGAMSAPYPPWREMLSTSWHPPWKPVQIGSLLKMLFEVAKLSGSVGGHGGSEEETGSECLYSVIHHVSVSVVLLWNNKSCTSLTIILSVCLSSCVENMVFDLPIFLKWMIFVIMGLNVWSVFKKNKQKNII